MVQTLLLLGDGHIEATIHRFAERLRSKAGLALQLAEHLQTIAEDALQCSLRQPCLVLDVALQLGQISALAELTQELAQQALAAPKHHAALDDQIPAGHRRQHQNRHDGLNHHAGLADQPPDRHLFDCVLHRCFLLPGRGSCK